MSTDKHDTNELPETGALPVGGPAVLQPGDEHSSRTPPPGLMIGAVAAAVVGVAMAGWALFGGEISPKPAPTAEVSLAQPSLPQISAPSTLTTGTATPSVTTSVTASGTPTSTPTPSPSATPTGRLKYLPSTTRRVGDQIRGEVWLDDPAAGHISPDGQKLNRAHATDCYEGVVPLTIEGRTFTQPSLRSVCDGPSMARQPAYLTGLRGHYNTFTTWVGLMPGSHLITVTVKIKVDGVVKRTAEVTYGQPADIAVSVRGANTVAIVVDPWVGDAVIGLGKPSLNYTTPAR